MLYTLDRATKNLEPARLSSLRHAGWEEKDLENVLVQHIDLVLR